MKQFANTFRPIDEILAERGFTLYGNRNRNYIAKISDGVYAVISGDLEITEVWEVNPEITNDEFINIMSGDDWDAYDALRDEEDTQITKKDICWAFGFN